MPWMAVQDLHSNTSTVSHCTCMHAAQGLPAAKRHVQHEVYWTCPVMRSMSGSASATVSVSYAFWGLLGHDGRISLEMLPDGCLPICQVCMIKETFMG